MNPSFLAHLIELRKRVLMSCASVCLLGLLSYVYYETLFTVLSTPFSNALSHGTDSFYIKSVLEGVLTKLRFSLLFGLVLSLPVFLYQGLRFSLPGLTKHEGRIILLSVLGSFILSVGSFCYGFWVLLPLSLKFLMSHHFIPDNVGVLLTYSESLFFVFNLLAALIVVFQVPLLVLLFLKLKLVSRRTLLRSSRYIVVGILLISAILTPPDVISQLLLSVPLVILFFLTLLLATCLRLGNDV